MKNQLIQKNRVAKISKTFSLLAFAFIFLSCASSSRRNIIPYIIQVKVKSGSVNISGTVRSIQKGKTSSQETIDKGQDSSLEKTIFISVPSYVYVTGEVFEHPFEYGQSVTLKIESVIDQSTVSCSKYKSGKSVVVKKEEPLVLLMSFEK